MNQTRQIRVLFQCSSLDPKYGGPSVSEASLCRALKEITDLQVLCPKEKIDTAFASSYGLNDVRPYTTRDVALALVRPQHWLSRSLKNADVLHQNAHWRLSTTLLSCLASQNRTPFILQPRGILSYGHRRVWIKKAFHWALGKKALSHAAAIIALSRFEATTISAFCQESRKLHVIPNGITFPTHREEKSPYGEKIPWVYLGRIEPRKNIVFLIEAFAKYRARGGKAPLVLVGPVEAGYDKVVREMITKHELSSEVSWLAPQYEAAKWPYLQHAKAVIYPALREAFGRVPFEAVAAGTVPILPKDSGAYEYLGELLPMAIYQTTEVESLVKVMLAMEMKTPSVAVAQTWLAQHLSWEKIASEFLSLYQTVGRPSAG